MIQKRRGVLSALFYGTVVGVVYILADYASMKFFRRLPLHQFAGGLAAAFAAVLLFLGERLARAEIDTNDEGVAHRAQGVGVPNSARVIQFVLDDCHDHQDPMHAGSVAAVKDEVKHI